MDAYTVSDNPQQQTAQQQPQRRVPGRPWRRGQSGNPRGHKVKAERIATLIAALAADFGGLENLSARDRCALESAAHLKLRAERTKSDEQAVRLANASAKLLRAVERKTPAKPTIGQIMGLRHGG